MTPNRWHTVCVTHPGPAHHPVVQALLGEQAAAELAEPALPPVHHLGPDSTGADPWLRIAVVDALDRWLQLPLDQSLVDAERGVCRGRAAQSLPRRRSPDRRPRRRPSPGPPGFGRADPSSARAHRPPATRSRRAGPRAETAHARLHGAGRDVTGPDRQLAAPVASWRILAERLDGEAGSDGPPSEVPAANSWRRREAAPGPSPLGQPDRSSTGAGAGVRAGGSGVGRGDAVRGEDRRAGRRPRLGYLPFPGRLIPTSGPGCWSV